MKKFITSLNLKKHPTSDKGKGRAELPSDGLVSVASTGQRENMANTLDGTIQIIQQIANLIPIDTAKNILIGITTILALLPKSIKNEASLNALSRSCKAICSTLAIATQNVPTRRMNNALNDALQELKTSIDEMLSRVNEALSHGQVRRLLTATIDERQISAWAGDLNMISTTFSARLNIVSSIRLEQIFELLQRSDVQQLGLIPDPPPPAPAFFFGREELLYHVKAALLRDEDVALIGPGGIGKSSLAKAVINDKDIKKRYVRRFFISYDGLDRTSMTFDIFTQRIASALGLPASGTESERQVRSNLDSSPVLLVLDNAETFEEAVNQIEAQRISSFVATIALASGVTVILTSRTRNNAREVRWTYFNVPPLEKVSARQYFQTVYHGDIQDNDIDALLGALDFHPLSIHILAYTAEESQWTGRRLLSEWQAQQGRLLQTGYGKENLGFTIRLSLNSPSVQAFGDDALNVLCTIAFFPQGINEDHAARLFPSVPHILSITDTLCRVSLAYRSGSFLTTLAPVRLFLLDAFPTSGFVLLWGVRQLYYDSLEALSEKSDFHAALVDSDHLNIEHLITFDIVHQQGDFQYTTRACSNFLRGLAGFKPRPTPLASIISSLSEESPVQKDSKAWCLERLGHLCVGLSNFSYGGAAFLGASKLFLAVGDYNMGALCTLNAARSYSDRGYFSHVRQLVNNVIYSPSWRYIDQQRKAGILYAQDEARMHTSFEGADKLFLHSMDDSYYGVRSQALHWRARMLHGYSTREETQGQLERLRLVCMTSGPWERWTFLSTAAEAAVLQRRPDVAMDLLCQAEDAVNGQIQLTLIVLSHRAAVASTQGDFNLARSILQNCVDTLGLLATPSSVHFLAMLYVQGRNELYAGNYAMAGQLLADVVAHCDACDEIGTKTLCTRALGEVEIRLGRGAESDGYFMQTMGLCREAGIPPELFGVCKPMTRLDDYRFPGWRTFLRARVG